MVKKLLLAVLLPIPIAVSIISCDSAPPVGTYGPYPEEVRDLSGLDFPTYCKWGPYWVPCDGGTD